MTGRRAATQRVANAKRERERAWPVYCILDEFGSEPLYGVARAIVRVVGPMASPSPRTQRLDLLPPAPTAAAATAPAPAAAAAAPSQGPPPDSDEDDEAERFGGLFGR